MTMLWLQGNEAWLVWVTASETGESLLKHASDVNTASTAQVPLKTITFSFWKKKWVF